MVIVRSNNVGDSDNLTDPVVVVTRVYFDSELRLEKEFHDALEPVLQN